MLNMISQEVTFQHCTLFSPQDTLYEASVIAVKTWPSKPKGQMYERSLNYNPNKFLLKETILFSSDLSVLK